MSVPIEEVVRHLDFAPEPAADPLILEADPDHLDFIPDDPAELRRAVTRMAAHINLADWRFVKLIAAMDRTRSWREGGYCNLGNWLDHRCGLGPCASRERIRIGRALAKLPRIDAAFRDGAISYSKVRAITRVATPHTEAMLLAIAEGSSAARLESLVRTYERVGGSVRGRDSSEQRRGLSWYYEDGMLVLTAAVPAERGALVIEALRQVVDGRKDEEEALRVPAGGHLSRGDRGGRGIRRGGGGRRWRDSRRGGTRGGRMHGGGSFDGCFRGNSGASRQWQRRRGGLRAGRKCGCHRYGCSRRCFRGSVGGSRWRGQRQSGLHADRQRGCD